MSDQDTFHRTLDAALARPDLIIHAVMYRDYQLGTLCDSRVWGPATAWSMITDHVTCPGCRDKIDGARTARTDDTVLADVTRFCHVMRESTNGVRREMAEDILSMIVGGGR